MNRKSLICEYKNSLPDMGIYQIRNMANGKILIGSSKNVVGIINRFKSELKLGGCRNESLQNEWHQFGPDAFEFEVLEVLEPINDPAYDPAEDFQILEQIWHEKLTPYGYRGYNREPKR